jgi:hypothetical protein
MILLSNARKEIDIFAEFIFLAWRPWFWHFIHYHKQRNILYVGDGLNRVRSVEYPVDHFLELLTRKFHDISKL